MKESLGETTLNNSLLESYKQDLENYKKYSEGIRLNIARETQNLQQECQNGFNAWQEEITLANLEAYGRTVRSLGNSIQRLLTLGVGGAFGHAAAGFPNA
jgi:hypothetical protein